MIQGYKTSLHANLLLQLQLESYQKLIESW